MKLSLGLDALMGPLESCRKDGPYGRKYLCDNAGSDEISRIINPLVLSHNLMNSWYQEV